ncbi:UDP-N-acetylglucosamine 1-carboxyvinyltransferase [Zunongwangia endophytica]|uniref:UDP-N-acetylglucosamine 1-carboxyvinyltransferase n=1 Tax=Zunongwangia endophytica TaxID=1808945 RepID=A0ABV8H8L7_9FLAO|nr:UDP-N-acetylglucosamine 1-carboxyvinyltransferase [Zunongwangia endophytica]MDN3596240.1 UDP-N-acetylglucosamine 1-carboxyvinyltransferase [Zunongwangia endophytica]
MNTNTNKNLSALIRGGQKPNGTVKVSGAKNAGTRLLAAATISDEIVQLNNFPTELVDVQYKVDFINKSGGKVVLDNSLDTVRIDPSGYVDSLLDNYEYPIRTTYLLVAGLIKRSGKARIPYPGGCKIGNRGYDLHIMVWKSLGAKVEEKEDYIEVTAPSGFKGGIVNFPISTIGGTENALISASISDNETIIKNAYISPEVESLIAFLKSMGVKIETVGNSYIKVEGAKYLRGSIFNVIPDRIEAITWIIYGIISGGNITVKDVPFEIMDIPLIHLEDAGINIYRNDKNVVVGPDCLVNGEIQPFELACGTHPGIISDMQPFYTLLGLHADGVSRIYDYRYPERLKYCEELNKFYNDAIEWQTGKIKTVGKSKISSATAKSTDLRGSMAVVLAALMADGDSKIENVEMALRGYNNLEKKLEGLGINIEITENFPEKM